MPSLVERPKMTCAMYQALKRHIMKEREKKKQDKQEQDAEMERQKKEREMRKKKEEKDSLTLEQNKEQISTLEKQLEQLKSEKHKLFSQLKKAIHEDDEKRRIQQHKEQSQMLVNHPYPQAMPVSGHTPANLDASNPRSGRPSMFKPAQSQGTVAVAGMKRARSPSPPPQNFMYPQYSGAQGETKYVPGQFNAGNPQHGPYTQRSSYQQPGSHFPVSQSGGKFTSTTPTNQSAFSSYPNHYPQQQTMKEHFVPGQPHGYQVPRMQQPGFMHGSPHRTLQTTGAMDTGSAQSKSVKDKYKMQQQTTTASQSQLVHPPPLPQAMMQHVQLSQPEPKGSIVTGYPVKTQVVTSTFQPPTVTQAQSTAIARGSYSSQQQSRFF